jgi:hypothetical protein
MKSIKLALTLAVTLAASAIAAHAQTLDVRTGLTTVNLSSGFVSALGTLKVTPSALGGSKLSGTFIDFPIVDGAVDLPDSQAEITHTGGLRLTAGKTVVDLRDFVIDATSGQATLTGLVIANGKLVGRLPLFELAINSSDIQNAGGLFLYIPDINVTLTSGAASALDGVFKTNALKGGVKIGTATVFGLTTSF